MSTDERKVTNLVWLLRLLVLVHTVVLFFQAVFAGSFLDGSASALGMHQLTGTSVITTISVLQVVVAVVCWRRRQIPAWFAVTSFGLFVGEMAQIGLGFTDQLSLHVPLGAAALAVSLVLLLGSLRHHELGDGHRAGLKGA